MRQQLKPSLVKGLRVAAPEVDLDHAEVNSPLEEPEGHLPQRELTVSIPLTQMLP